MAGELDGAIKLRWDDAGLNELVSGGLHFASVPRADALGRPIRPPYAVLSHVAKAPAIWTSTSQVHDYTLQLAIYAGGKFEAEGLAAAIKSAFDFAPLAPSTGVVLEVRPLNHDGLVEKPADGVWQALLTYRIRWALPL